MTFDLSRIRFDHRKDFLGVVMQQGRVQLDADWNEWVAQLARRLQAGTLDTFGGNVVPRITPEGFRIEAAGGGLTIGAGRIYVDGLLAENHGGEPDAWERRLAGMTGTTALDYTAQPYYPDPPALPDGGPHLVFVDVWQREIGAVEDPEHLIEPAVGVDTTGRLQTVWQVKVLPNVGDISCATPDEDIPDWPQTIAPSAARLSTDTAVPDFEPDPCQVPPAAGYRGLENQLYRVEVHTGGALGTATFKWSRDNATVAARVTHLDAARERITVESIGRDEVLRFRDGDWVEVTDDWRELHGLPGELRRIRVAGGVDETERTLSFDVALSAGLFPTDAQDATTPARNTRVRRWDQSGLVREEDGSEADNLDEPGSSGEITIPPAGTRLFLEHGILVEFDLDPAGGEFHSGDYWVFAARSATADIEHLDHAPPLGIHHHYARLAVVDFPDGETDCRTLWPPIAEGAGCDCTVCVSAETHNDGTATLQQAIDSIKDAGGTICLGVGTYEIRAPLTVDGARSLRIRGQGWATLLVGSEPGGVVGIAGGTGVALENLTVIGSASGGTAAMVAAHNVIDLRLEHINVLGLAVGDGTSVGIGLAGFALGASLTDCAIVAERGLAAVTLDDRDYLLAAELRTARNLFFCSRRAVSLDGTCLHYGVTRIADNLMLGCGQAAIVATGAVLPGSPFAIADNTIHTRGDGIRAGVDGLAIERNEIAGMGGQGGDGIVLEEGLDPVALDQLRVAGNRLRGLAGNAMRIAHRLESAIVVDNLVDGIGLGALVMSEGGAAGQLTISGNQWRNLGLAVGADDAAFAAIQLVGVERGEFCGNAIDDVARNAVATPAIDALRALALGKLRIAANRLDGIGPERSSGEVAAIRLLPPFDSVQLDGNHIERQGESGQNLALAIWRAIHIAPEAAGTRTGLAAAGYLATAEIAYLLTATRVVALPVRPPSASLRGNHLRGQLSDVELVLCTATDHCLFADNRGEALGEAGREPRIANLGARTLTATGNRLIAAAEMDTVHLHPQRERAIVTSNTSTGNIRVQGGSPVPPDLLLTNIIGI